MQYTDIFSEAEIGFFLCFHIFALNIDFGYMLELPRRDGPSEYPLSMFGIKKIKICIPLKTPVLLYNSGAIRGNTFHVLLMSLLLVFKCLRRKEQNT